MLGDHMRPDLQEQDVCEGCGDYIMYYSPEQFDPVCIDEETEATHCEHCCACYEVTKYWPITQEKTFKYVYKTLPTKE